jgi:Zn-dependent protease with chaperone function
MSYELRVLAVGLAAFAFAGAAAGLAVPLIVARLRNARPAVRARQLVLLRLIPGVFAIAAGLLVTVSFLAFEPRTEGESIGWMAPAMGLFGAIVIADAAWRLSRIMLATRRLARTWFASARPVPLDGISIPAFATASEFPIVAVVGVRRPKLIIATSVIEACSPEELRAILAHEQGHLDRRDNLRRLLMSVAPDALAWFPASEKLLRSWRAATEEVADDHAARDGANGRLHLASALIKVARLADRNKVTDLMPAATLFCGENLSARVRRLLGPQAAPDRAALVTWRTVAGAAGLIVASAFALQGLQELVEETIHWLP